MNLLFKLPFFIATWCLFLLLRTSFIILGWILVPIAVLLKCYEMRNSSISNNKIIRAFTCKFMWPWGNEEEGIGVYGDQSWSTQLRIVYSECLRNPANNLRYVPFLSLKIDPNLIDFTGSFGSKSDNLSKETIYKYDDNKELFWSLTCCGLYSNIRFHFKLLDARYRFWLGWKIHPEDMFGISETSHRYASAGFATQFKKIN